MGLHGIIICLLCLFFLLSGIHSPVYSESRQEKEKRMEWWRSSRFGLFIHWGLYALPARHEWGKRYERMTNKEYEKYFHLFNPDLYNPGEWAR